MSNTMTQPEQRETGRCGVPILNGPNEPATSCAEAEDHDDRPCAPAGPRKPGVTFQLVRQEWIPDAASVFKQRLVERVVRHVRLEPLYLAGIHDALGEAHDDGKWHLSTEKVPAIAASLFPGHDTSDARWDNGRPAVTYVVRIADQPVVPLEGDYFTPKPGQVPSWNPSRAATPTLHRTTLYGKPEKTWAISFGGFRSYTLENIESDELHGLTRAVLHKIARGGDARWCLDMGADILFGADGAKAVLDLLTRYGFDLGMRPWSVPT